MKAFEATDVFKHRTLAELNGSTQHDRLVFNLTRAKEQDDDYETTAWCLSNVDEAPRPMTSAEFSVGTPKWNSDGTLLAFISKRGDGGSQVHLMPGDGGEARRLSNLHQAVSTLHGWLPDDSALLVSAACNWNEDHDPDAPNGKRSPAVVCYLPYKRDGSGILVGERTHLFSIDAKTGEATRLTKGDFDIASARWSGDGRHLAYVRDRPERERCHADLWIADADGGNARRRVSTISSISSVTWSPDNRRILFSGSVEPGDSRSRLWCVDVHGDDAPVQLGGEDFELEPGTQIGWHPDGDRIAMVCIDQGLMRLAVVTMRDGAVRVIDRALRAVNLCAAWGDRLAFVSTSMRRLEEVHSMRWDGTDERRHTRFNRWFRKRPRPKVVRRRFDVPDGDGGIESIRAWVLTPSRGKGPFPLLVDMHGGPHSNVLVDFAAHTYWYLFLQKGWAIVAPDAVGSSGYGTAFARRLRGRWGALDLPQYEAVVRRLQAQGVCDDRVACAGKSYGGFLSAWAIGHSDLFRAAVVCAPVANLESHFGTSDTGHYVTPWLMDGEATDHRARWHDVSVLDALPNARTPTLLLQGENDGRCPRGQSEEVFAHLIRYTRTPVELVLYPQSTHAEAERGRPSNRVDYHNRIVAWGERWVVCGGENS